MTDDTKYNLPDDLGQLFWDTMYQDHLFIHDEKLDKLDLADLLSEKLKPLWEAELQKVSDKNYDRGYGHGWTDGEIAGWTEGYRSATSEQEA